MNLYQILQDNISSLIQHGVQGTNGHDRFTKNYASTLTMETLGYKSSDTALKNKEDMLESRNALEQQIKSLNMDMEYATSDLNKIAHTFENTKRLFHR